MSFFGWLGRALTFSDPRGLTFTEAESDPELREEIEAARREGGLAGSPVTFYVNLEDE